MFKEGMRVLVTSWDGLLKHPRVGRTATIKHVDTDPGEEYPIELVFDCDNVPISVKPSEIRLIEMENV